MDDNKDVYIKTPVKMLSKVNKVSHSWQQPNKYY